MVMYNVVVVNRDDSVIISTHRAKTAEGVQTKLLTDTNRFLHERCENNEWTPCNNYAEAVRYWNEMGCIVATDW